MGVEAIDLKFIETSDIMYLLFIDLGNLKYSE
jgi:hypothetical protein